MWGPDGYALQWLIGDALGQQHGSRSRRGAAVQELGGRAGAKTSWGCQCGARWWASAVGCLGEASRGLPNEDDAVLSVVEGHRHDVRVQPARDERTRLRRMGMGA